jgi:outer membrane protein assembly factor BamB
MQKTRTRFLTRSLLASAATLALAAAAHAVTPGQFTHTTEADFADGDAYGTVVTNLGDIKLSSETLPLDGLPEDVTVIHDIAKVGEEIYVAAGPEAKILKVTDEGVEVVAEYEGEQVFSIADYEGDLLIGVSVMEAARIDRLVDGQAVKLADLPETTYVWDLLPAGSDAQGPDRLLIATGTPGKVLSMAERDQKITVLLETQQSNILTLATDDKGNVYAGTDTDGLVYRIDKDGNPFVVFDAPEAEIAALAVMPDGTLYAGTAAAEQARPGRLEQPTAEEEGRADVPDPGLPNQPPKPEELDQPIDGVGEDVEAAGDAVRDAANDAEDALEDAAEGGADDTLSDEEAGQPEPPKPTAEQYDALRQALKDKLEKARETGQLDGEINGGNGNAGNAGPDRPSRAKPAAPARAKPGNAVYRIAPDGFVTEVFRESAMVLAIVPNDGKLIVATGNEGQVFSVDPSLGESAVLTDLDSAQVTSATHTDRGLLLGAANPGALMRMEMSVAEQGGYTSQVLDAGQPSLFGTFKLTADIPEGTTVAIELRSGNVGDPEQAAWSKWSKPALIEYDQDANPLQPRELKIGVPPARYLQYRLTLTGDGQATPVVDQADLAYIAPNTAPTVAKLTVNVPKVGEPGSDPNPKYTIQWQATDNNSDRLVYSLEYKPGKADAYLPLADDLTANKYEWATQHVPDGWYTVRLTAHDKLDNPPNAAKSGGRVSEPVLIDNSAPALDGLEAEVLGDGKVKLTATAKDELSAIASVAYSVDGSEAYQASLPDDQIYDSTSEAWGVTIPDLSPGGHVIAVRAIDARGNTAYRQLIVNVE